MSWGGGVILSMLVSSNSADWDREADERYDLFAGVCWNGPDVINEGNGGPGEDAVGAATLETPAAPAAEGLRISAHVGGWSTGSARRRPPFTLARCSYFESTSSGYRPI
jgi:hypothetical protein